MSTSRDSAPPSSIRSPAPALSSTSASRAKGKFSIKCNAEPHSPCLSGRASSLLMWTEEEVDWFADRLNKQVFNSQSGISLVSSCVATLRRQAETLVSSGTDVIFMMDIRLQPTCEKLIMEARDKAVEAVKLRWAEETWSDHNTGSRQNLDKTVLELSNVGVANISSFVVSDSSSLQLTSNTVSFTQAYLSLTEHLVQLLTPGTRHLVNER